MTSFKINGRHKTIDKRELRAMLHAAAVVLEYHNLHPRKDRVTVVLKKDKTMGKCMNSQDAVGWAWTSNAKMALHDSRTHDQTFITVVHEMIHLCLEMPSGATEKCTSTLVNRLMPTIIEVYEALADGVMQRAAFIAHTKISYVPEGEDFYDSDQWKVPPIDTPSAHLRKGVKA